MRKEHKTGMILLSAAVLFLCIVMIFPYLNKKSIDENEEKNTESIIIEKNQDEVSYTGYIERLYVYADTIDKKDEVSWWYGEEDGRYYLFLPSAMQNKDLYLSFDGVNEVLWNDTLYANEECIGSVSPGDYMITSLDTQVQYPLTVLQTDGVPSMFIHTQSGTIETVNESKEYRDPGEFLILNADDTVDSEGTLEYIRGRGNLSWVFDKKGYQIRSIEKTSLLSMESAKNWILLPNSLDRTYLKNEMMYALAQEMDLSYTPKGEAVDLYVDGLYLGLYLISEKIEVGTNRVDIVDLEKNTEQINSKVPEEYEHYGFYPEEETVTKGSTKGYEIEKNPKDITGGYLLEAEFDTRYGSEPSGFVTNKGQPVVIKSPTYASRQQVDYISQLYQEFEEAIFSLDGMNQKTGKHYTDYIDLQSFVRKYLLEEICKNPDAGKTSQFFYKQPDYISEKLYAGPIWDYDYAFGAFVSHNDNSLRNPTGLWAAYPIYEYSWFSALYNKPDFYEQVIYVYENELLPLMEGVVENGISAAAEEIAESANMDYIRWEYFDDEDGICGNRRRAYLEETQKLKRFCEKRISFLSAVWLENKEYYNVNLAVDDDFYCTVITVLEGDCVEILDTPKKEGYTFLGWKRSREETLFDMNTPILEEGILLEPVWEQIPEADE